jgi:hypothetical protein
MKVSKAAIILALGLAVLASKAEASVVIDILQRGGNVVTTATGAIDLTGLTFVLNANLTAPGVVAPAAGMVAVGTTGAAISYYSGASGPGSFGGGGSTTASSGSGDALGVLATILPELNPPLVVVPKDYASGSWLSGSSTYDGQTIASLGLNPGTYVYTWNSSPVPVAFQDDSVTVFIAVPEPTTWAMMTLGFAALGFVGYRATRKGAAFAWIVRAKLN